MLKLNPGYSGKGNIGQGIFACIFGAYGDVRSGLSARRWQRGSACRGIPDGMITGRDGNGKSDRNRGDNSDAGTDVRFAKAFHVAPILSRLETA